MNRYKLIVLTGGGFTQEFEVTADSFHTTTSSSAASGFYSFYLNKKFIGSFPIERTIIQDVQEIEIKD